MTSRITVNTQAREAIRREVSPVSMILVVPKVEQYPGAADTDITIPAAENTLVRVTSGNEDTVLGAGFAKAAYDFIESGAVVDLYVLPFAVDTSDDAPANRLPRVTAALDVLDTAIEKGKLPHRKADVIVLPRETGVVGAAANNPVITKLKTFDDPNTHIGALALCDAGELTIIAGQDQVAVGSGPSQTQVENWENANAGPNIYAVTNRGNVSGYTGMWGSVVVASHVAEGTGRYGIQHNSFNLHGDNVLRGADNFDPDRQFDPFDGSSEADLLSKPPHHLTSLIDWEGLHYTWGGLSMFPSTDPRQHFSNNLVAHRMVKEAARDMVPYIERRAYPDVLESMRTKIEEDLRATYVPLAAERITAHNPALVGDGLQLLVTVKFYRFIRSIILTVEVYE